MYAAMIEIGWMKQVVEGESANAIIDAISRYQDFGCLVTMAKQRESSYTYSKLKAFVDKYRKRALTMDDIKNLDIGLSIGSIRCHGVAEGDEEIEKLKENAKDI